MERREGAGPRVPSRAWLALLAAFLVYTVFRLVQMTVWLIRALL